MIVRFALPLLVLGLNCPAEAQATLRDTTAQAQADEYRADSSDDFDLTDVAISHEVHKITSASALENALSDRGACKGVVGTAANLLSRACAVMLHVYENEGTGRWYVVAVPVFALEAQPHATLAIRPPKSVVTIGIDNEAALVRFKDLLPRQDPVPLPGTEGSWRYSFSLVFGYRQNAGAKVLPEDYFDPDRYRQ